MSLSRLDVRGVPAADLAGVLPGPGFETFPTDAVRGILAEVRRSGDAALADMTDRFDQVKVVNLRVPALEIDAARDAVPSTLREALELAWRRILAYHRHEPAALGDFELDGVRVQHLVRAVRRAGIYAPGGRARYPSTVLMCAAPARVAGVEQLVLVAPPNADGRVATETLAAASIAGISEVYAVGGAQAIGALAFGTETISGVDLIVGPGSAWVAEGKRQVAGVVGVPSGFAGPSEVVVVADGSAPTKWTAVDLVVQAEHGPDGLAWLVTWSEPVAEEVDAEIERMVASSSRRDDLEATLAHGGHTVLVDGPDQAMAVANIVAPEHLELHVAEPERLLAEVRWAGAVFVGPFAPASVGDYLAGPNHVLPTARTARFSSALRVDDFRTHIHAVDLGPAALRALAPAVVTLAEAEGLPAHAESVRLRVLDPGSVTSAGDVN